MFRYSILFISVVLLLYTSPVFGESSYSFVSTCGNNTCLTGTIVNITVTEIGECQTLISYSFTKPPNGCDVSNIVIDYPNNDDPDLSGGT